MKVQTYLFFNGRCEEAATFYRENLGAEISEMMRFNEIPPQDGAPDMAPGSEEKIMHMSLQIGESTVMASDGMSNDEAQFKGFSLTLIVANEAEAQRLFALLSDGGQVEMPLSPTFFSPLFGMVADRFGVSWMIYTEQ